MNIYPACISKRNSNHKKQSILLMISNRGWHYFASKKLSALLRGIISKHSGNFYCLNSLHSFRKNKLDHHKRICEKKDFCGDVMPSKDTKILEFNQCWKYDKTWCAVLESLIKVTDGCKIILKNHLKNHKGR